MILRNLFETASIGITSVASIGNVACLMNTQEASQNEVMKELEEASHW